MKAIAIPFFMLLSACIISSCGSDTTKEEEVNNTSEASANEGSLAPKPETGSWELLQYVDEFGDKTNDNYLAIEGHGTFSNSAATNSPMSVVYFVEKKNPFEFSMRIMEYGSYVVKDGNTYKCRMKDSAGEVYEIKLFNNENSGRIYTYNEDDLETMKIVLSNEGEASFSVTENKTNGTPSTYIFKLDFTGFKKALNLLD